jgi:tRNA threonylcarbamoyl adenosine modification protein (Sua5/YciO/YrdC/YwlC family)
MLYKLHADNPEPRVVSKVVDLLNKDGVIALPTSSSYALVCKYDSKEGIKRIRKIRSLDEKHDFTLICSNFKQVGKFVRLTTSQFRVVNKLPASKYTFILNPATDIKKYLLTKKKTIGIRIQGEPLARDLLNQFEYPLASTTCIIPPNTEAESDPEKINEKLGKFIDAILDIGWVNPERTTVIDWTQKDPLVIREGAGKIDFL